MKARDIMTAPVITIAPDTAIRDVACLLLERGISGVPVVEGTHVAGIVSEGDLLRRHEIDTDPKGPRGSWWVRLLRGEPGPAEYVKSHAVRAADVMSRPVISVPETAALSEVAIILGKRNIKRLPVLRGERLVGIVTRANVVRALAAAMPAVSPPGAPGDEAIRASLLRELGAQSWWHETSNVIVTDGVVHYWGVCEDEDEKRAARVAAENIPGVRRIDDHRITYAELPSMG
jgi:CBS domain-containing protein